MSVKLLLYKSITWRLVAILTSLMLGLMLGLSVPKSILLTVILNTVNAIAYFIHDYIWLIFIKRAK